MTTTVLPLPQSIKNALEVFLKTDAPDYMVQAIQEDIETPISAYKQGHINWDVLTGAIYETGIYTLRDITEDEQTTYSLIMTMTLNAHGHFGESK